MQPMSRAGIPTEVKDASTTTGQHRGDCRWTSSRLSSTGGAVSCTSTVNGTVPVCISVISHNRPGTAAPHRPRTTPGHDLRVGEVIGGATRRASAASSALKTGESAKRSAGMKQ